MKGPIISLIGKNQCNGCSVCVAVCPYDAIHMGENEDGFLEPKLNVEECTNCGTCGEVCPINSFENNNTKDFVCYAAWSLDKENVLKSSSGGIFLK